MGRCRCLWRCNFHFKKKHPFARFSVVICANVNANAHAHAHGFWCRLSLWIWIWIWIRIYSQLWIVL